MTTPTEFLEVAEVLRAPIRPGGVRLGLVTDGGGHGVLGASVAESHGLELPPLSPALTAAVSAIIPDRSEIRNPVDVAGGASFELRMFPEVMQALAESDQIDVAMFSGMFCGYGLESPEYAADEIETVSAMVKAEAAAGKPFIVHTWYDDEAPAALLRDGSVPVFGSIEAAIRGIAHAAALQRPIRDVTPLPRPSGEPSLDSAEFSDPYWHARHLVAAAGVRLADAQVATTIDEACATAASVGYPVVVKALGRTHKSEGGGVILGITDEAELRVALAALHDRLAPPEVSVEHMQTAAGFELLIGVRRDPSFGPIALVGSGGIFAETFPDVAASLMPLDPLQARELIGTLKVAPALLGARDRPPLDVAAAADALIALGEILIADPRIAEIEINPLLVTADGAVGLDARIVTR